MKVSIERRCACLHPDCDQDAFHETDRGVDDRYWRSFDVTLLDCRFCGSRWLHYALVDESQPRTALWFRGPISADQYHLITSENASRILADLPWCFTGGTEQESHLHRGLHSASTPLAHLACSH